MSHCTWHGKVRTMSHLWVKFYTRDTAKCAWCHTCEWSFTHLTQQNMHDVTLVSEVLHTWHSKVCTMSHLWVKFYTRDTARCARCHTCEWSFTHVTQQGVHDVTLVSMKFYARDTARYARCHTCECEVLHTWQQNVHDVTLARRYVCNLRFASLKGFDQKSVTLSWTLHHYYFLRVIKILWGSVKIYQKNCHHASNLPIHHICILINRAQKINNSNTTGNVCSCLDWS